MPSRIEDYALLGDGQTAALVARDGSVDWLCWPRFDSDACFAALLGTEDNGRWRIGPADRQARPRRRYRAGTLVLDTEFATGSGAALLTDFMPIREDGASSLVRILTGLRGQVRMEFDLGLRFDYGSMKPWIRTGKNEIQGVVGPDLVVLRSDLELEASQDNVHRGFTLSEGQTIACTLQYGASHKPAPAPLDARRALADTEAHWREWIGRFDKTTEWKEAVERSLITLKALVHRPTGGLIAAPTLGLPEKPHGGMNWDYRYCWLRDSTFTLSALLNAGYHEEAQAWLHWLLRAIAGVPDKIRIAYRVDGSRRLEEWSVPWLSGYEGATPVRVGNAASGQRQLDIFGEVLDSMHLAERAGIRREQWSVDVETRLIEHLETIWRQPDQGMWESRGEPRNYTYSKVMAWVAVDRFIKGDLTSRCTDEAVMRRLRGLHETMHAEICRHGFSEARNSFVKHYGSRELDASVLLLPLVGFLPATDPRMRGTIDAIQRELTEDGLVRRHEAPEAGREEGSFIACTCWLADCLGMQERHGEARASLERVLALRNDVGLLSEEYHVPRRRMMGNFPQALSHLGVVNTALGLSGPVLQRGGG